MLEAEEHPVKLPGTYSSFSSETYAMKHSIKGSNEHDKHLGLIPSDLHSLVKSIEGTHTGHTKRSHSNMDPVSRGNIPL